jgi:DNA-binding SARP family transcriptional activator
MRHIELLGGLRVTENAHALNVSGARAVSLLAYLALHPHTPHAREFLAELLSPDAPPERVRRNFTDALYRLRQTLGADWLEVDAERVGLAENAALTVDVWEFERLAASAERDSLERAAALYTGDLLPEIYDDWILAPRLALQEKFLSVLETLAHTYETQNDLTRALSYARQLTTADPLRETSHQIYLRLLARLKRRSQALEHFEFVRQLFQTELGVEPLKETQALVEAIRREAQSAPDVLPIVEQTHFVGRAPERAIGIDRLEQALTGRGGILLLEGEAGIGKSRLLRELAASAQWRKMLTAYSGARDTPEASPFSPLADALGPLLRGARAAQLESILPDTTLGALSVLYAPWQNRAALPELPPAQALARFRQHFITLAQTLSQFAPLVLILDDLHWADAALWDLLDALAPHTPHTPLVLCAAYRRPEIEKNAGWEMLRRWERAGLAQTVALKPLTAADISTLLPPDARADAARVIALTGGNPFYISEYLTERAEGLNAAHPSLTARLDTLSEPTRAALEGAAVLGEQVAFWLWAKVAQISPLALAAAAEELTARAFLQPTSAGYEFAHDLVRTAVYDRLTPARRVAFHSRAADALAEREPENWRARAFQLERAERSAEAAGAYRHAGAQDLAQFAFRDAQTAFLRALALLPDAPDVARVETALLLARAADALGERKNQQHALEEALRNARALENDALTLQALVMSGRVAALTGRSADARVFFDEAFELAQRLDDPPQEFEALFWRGDAAARRGELAAARADYERALELARRENLLQSQGRALRALGNLARQEGKPDQALVLHAQAIQAQHTSGDLYNEAVTRVTMVGALYDLGAWDRLLTAGHEAVALCERLDHRLGAAVARHMLATGAYALGDFETARALLPRVFADCQAVGDRRTAGLALNVLGLVEADSGNFEAAHELYAQALEVALEVDAATEAAYARHDWGVLCLQLGEWDRARELLDAARATWQQQQHTLLQRKTEAYLGLAHCALNERARAAELANVGLETLRGEPLQGEQPQGWHWALYQLLLKLERPADANNALRAAYREVQRQGSVIGDHAVRASFFERVPLNRAIIAAHDALAPTPRRVTVLLARRDAPLGRTLTDAERVTVTWTLDAPEDELIRGKTARRQYRLRRLLAEAHAQIAAPTDDELARALGVSRHTILRDMAALAERGEKSRTRRRKAISNR